MYCNFVIVNDGVATLKKEANEMIHHKFMSCIDFHDAVCMYQYVAAGNSVKRSISLKRLFQDLCCFCLSVHCISTYRLRGMLKTWEHYKVALVGGIWHLPLRDPVLPDGENTGSVSGRADAILVNNLHDGCGRWA